MGGDLLDSEGETQVGIEEISSTTTQDLDKFTLENFVHVKEVNLALAIVNQLTRGKGVLFQQMFLFFSLYHR